jgi:membrane protein
MEKMIKITKWIKIILGVVIIISYIILIELPDYKHDYHIEKYFSVGKEKNILQKVDSLIEHNPQYTEITNIQHLNVDSLLKRNRDYSLVKKGPNKRIIKIRNDSNIYGHVYTRKIYLKNDNLIVEFIFKDNFTNELFISSYDILNDKEWSSKNLIDNWNHYQELKHLKNTFERNFLNKIGKFEKDKKNNIIQLIDIYYIFFFHNQLYFLEIFILLIIIKGLLKSIITKETYKIYLYTSLLVFIISLIFPFFKYNNRESLSPIDFGASFTPIGLFNLAWGGFGAGFMCLANLSYYISLWWYKKNKNGFYYFISASIILALLILLPVDYIKSSEYQTSIIRYCIGYFIWIISFIILLYGYYVTSKERN